MQLWHAESGALVGQATAHAEGATIFAMALRGGLLLAAGTEAAIAMHATRAATAHAWLTTARSTSSTAAADAADDSAAPPAASVVATSSCVSGEDAGELAGGSGATGTGSIGGLGFGGRAGGGSAMAPACPSCVQLCRATGHLEAVACLELHGGWLLSGAQDGRVLVHAAGRPKPFLALPAAHTAPVVNIFGAGSSFMLSVGRDGSARLWALPRARVCGSSTCSLRRRRRRRRQRHRSSWRPTAEQQQRSPFKRCVPMGRISGSLPTAASVHRRMALRPTMSLEWRLFRAL